LDLQRFPWVARNDLALRPALTLRHKIGQEDYDIVHLHTKRAHALCAWLGRKNRRTKYVVTRRMDYPEKNNLRTRWLYNRRVDGVVAISRTIANLLGQAGVDSNKIRLIYSGIDPDRFERRRGAASTRGDPWVVGTIAAMEARKGHRFLLEAAARLKSQGCKIEYRLAGDGPLLDQLKQLANKLGLAGDVRFCGFVADTSAFLADIDLFVLPSLHEGLGVAALEAMAAGLPVIASGIGGLAESVIDSLTGFLVAPQDPFALADAIARLTRDRAAAEIMGRRGAERVRDCFTLERMARQNEAYYYELLGAAG
jgi:glycosyltransferase involved in cell wall biosynthesis